MDLAIATEAFVDHLERVRRLSPATVKAYRSDLRDLQTSAGGVALEDVDLEVLRDWLWRATQRGDARSTLARRDPLQPRMTSWTITARPSRCSAWTIANVKASLPPPDGSTAAT